ncbi:MAG: hypothetical protein KBC27_02885 [Rickettsiales bacterium]|nr:hypothetical protein [Rickettsiales bacterium]
MPGFNEDNLRSFLVEGPNFPGKRFVLISDYTTAHLDQIGNAWSGSGASKIYLPIPKDSINVDGYDIDGDEKVGVTGISESILSLDKIPFQVTAAMSLKGAHWVGFTIDVTAKGKATVRYVDSLNNVLEMKWHDQEVEKEYQRICSILRNNKFTISKESGVYTEALQQRDPVSCGGYLFENASRALGSKDVKSTPSEIEIRREQMKLLSKDALKTVSLNEVLYTRMFVEAQHNVDFGTGRFLELMTHDKEFAEAIKYEYDITDEQLKSEKDSHKDMRSRVFLDINKIFTRQRNMWLDCKKIEDNFMTIDQIEVLAKQRWLELKSQDKSSKMSDGDFVHFNKGLIKSYAIELTSRLMSRAKVKTFKEFDAVQERNKPSLGKSIGKGFYTVVSMFVKIITTILYPVVWCAKKIPNMFIKETKSTGSANLHRVVGSKDRGAPQAGSGHKRSSFVSREESRKKSRQASKKER